MRQSSILVLSDIHFGKLANSRDFALPGSPPKHEIAGAVPMKNAMIETAKLAAHVPVSALFVSGDLTSVASPAEFSGSTNLIAEIATGIGVSRENVLMTFGNHDVDWRICKLGYETETNPADDRLYDHVAANSGGLFAKNMNCSERGPVPGSGVFERDALTVFLVNSGFFCISDQEYRHGKMGNEQYSWLESALANHQTLDKWRILVLHHHPFKYPFPTLIRDISCLEEGADLVELAGKNGIHLICHGHRHEPKLFTAMQSGWRYPMTFFCAGSVAVVPSERNLGEIPNFFHLVTLKEILPSGAAFGSVRTFEYHSARGWIDAQMGEMAPLDPIQWFGVAATENEQQQAVRDLIVQIGKLEDDRWLPPTDELPPTLRCIRVRDLNRLVQAEGLAHGLQPIAKYPDRVLMVNV